MEYMGKTILTGIEAIEAYEELQGSYSSSGLPKKCGYFNAADCGATNYYDKGTIIAFDSTSGESYELDFGNVEDAIEWILA